MLLLKPEEIETVEKRGKYTVSVIGCEKSGVFHAYLFAEAGYKVTCVDPDQTIVNHVARGKIPFLEAERETRLRDHVKTGQVTATSDLKTAVSRSDIIIVTTPIRIDDKRKPDYSVIESACKKVGQSLRRGSIVIITEVTGMNITHSLVKELLENTSGLKVGTDFGLAYSPLSFSHGQTLEGLVKRERIVAAADKNSLNGASTLLETVTGNLVRRTESLKTAEAAILLCEIQQNVNSALLNEFALFCEKSGIDHSDAVKLVDPTGSSMTSMAKFPDGNGQKASRLLLEEAENLNAKLRIPAIAMQVNEEIVGHVVNLVKEALRSCGKTPRRARVAILGVSQTPNVRDFPKESINELVKMLESKGAKVSLYDPYFSGDELPDMQKSFKKNLTEALEGADCIVILTGHDQFERMNLKKLKALMKMPAAIVDVERILEPDKIEKEGFAYRGLGRGGLEK
jgi:nucleotide sugar dehydrogenase